VSLRALRPRAAQCGGPAAARASLTIFVPVKPAWGSGLGRGTGWPRITQPNRMNGHGASADKMSFKAGQNPMHVTKENIKEFSQGSFDMMEAQSRHETLHVLSVLS